MASNVIHLEHPVRFTRLVGIRVPDTYCGLRGGSAQTRPVAQHHDVTCARCVPGLRNLRTHECKALCRRNGCYITGQPVASPAPSKITAATINAELRKRGIAERLVQGEGYVYFIEGEAHCWGSSSIPVCYVSHLIEEIDGVPNLEATVAYVLRERARLRKEA